MLKIYEKSNSTQGSVAKTVRGSWCNNQGNSPGVWVLGTPSLCATSSILSHVLDMVKDMADEIQSAVIGGENDADINGDARENGDIENEIDDDLDDAMFDDPEDFVDQISDEGLH